MSDYKIFTAYCKIVITLETYDLPYYKSKKGI